MEEKKDVWNLTVEVLANYHVCFDRQVTKQEAIELFNSRDYEDVIDEIALSEIAIG